MSEFFTHRNIKATRKEHPCQGCAAKIAPGDPAWYFSMKNDGHFWVGHYHDQCRVAECELNDLHDNCGDDWIGLASITDEPEDVAWLVDEHPAVAARMNLTKPVAASLSPNTPIRPSSGSASCGVGVGDFASHEDASA